jgi:hypothetical protein
MKLKANTVIIIIIPGKTVNQGESLRNSLPSFNIVSHSAVGGRAPSPRNPRAEIVSIYHILCENILKILKLNHQKHMVINTKSIYFFILVSFFKNIKISIIPLFSGNCKNFLIINFSYKN